MWLGDQITQKGFGNGVSILIFVNIVSQIPSTVNSVYTLKTAGEISIIEILLFLVGSILKDIEHVGGTTVITTIKEEPKWLKRAKKCKMH